MNNVPSPVWSDRTSAARLTGTWRSALPDYRTLPSPCLAACPVNGRIAEWMHALAQKDVRSAWLTLMDNNPFPAVIGRICHHPCQRACNRNDMDETVGICSLERFVGDAALAAGWTAPSAKTARPQRVAIIGGGPAGLSAAYQLLRRGYGVTLYESKGQLGGLMRYGIPEYRLDKTVLEAEIARIVALGLRVRMNAEVRSAKALRALHKKFDAVFLATGAARPKRLPGLDYTAPHVIDSADFLAAVNEGRDTGAGARVLVIGGGSAAMDVARSAARLDCAVSVAALEAADRLPAQRTEVTEAFEEGIDFLTGSMVKSVKQQEGALDVTCVKVDFQAGSDGNFSVTPIADSEFTLQADTIIPAIGQDADLARWADLAADGGTLLHVDGSGQTARDGIYAGGDLTSRDRFVSAAIGMGKDAALSIHTRLSAERPDVPAASAPVPYQAINIAYQMRAARNHRASLPVAARVGNFSEVQQPLTEVAALAEAMRCFSCGTCILCDNCYLYCPDMAIRKLEHGYEVLTDYCKGCGLCVAECPTGAVQMYGEGAK